MVSNIFYFYPYLGRWSNLTNIFQMGWNHHLVIVVVVDDDDDDCCCNYLDDSMSWKMVKVSYYVQVLAIKMLWRRQQLISLQWQFPGSLPWIGCLQKTKITNIYIYNIMTEICVTTLVTLLWLNQESHTKWCFCFGSHSPQSFKYVESICVDSGHY